MMTFQRIGGQAALLAAGTYIVGFWLYFTILASAEYGSTQVDPAQHVRFLIENQSLMLVWNLTIYAANAVLLVVLAIALHQRVRTGSAALAQTATAFALIWAGLILASGMLANVGMDAVIRLYPHDSEAAGLLWRSVTTIEEGLGGGNEIAGGLWILLVSWAGSRSKALPIALAWLGVVIGVAGLLTVIPAMSEAASVFGLGFIVWFFWVGLVLLFGKSSQQLSAATQSDASEPKSA